MERDKDVVTTQMVSHLRVPDHAASQKTVLLKLRRVWIAFCSVPGTAPGQDVRPHYLGLN